MHDALPIHPTMTDPRTGKPLVAVGFSRRGPIWPVMGGNGEGGSGSGSGEGSAGGAGTGSGSGDSGQGTGGTGSGGSGTGSAGGDGGTGSGQGGAGTGTGAGSSSGGTGDGGQGNANDDQVSSLPQWAQDLISRTRDEAASNRTKAKEFETKHQGVLDSIAKALGLKEDEKPDPEKLTQQLTESQQQNGTLTNEVKALKVERALEKAAGKHKADAELLVAVLAHGGKLATLDPSADDFATKLDALVKDTVEKNPKLRGGQAPARSGAEFTGGSGSSQQPNSLGAAIAAHYGK